MENEDKITTFKKQWCVLTTVFIIIIILISVFSQNDTENDIVEESSKHQSQIDCTIYYNLLDKIISTSRNQQKMNGINEELIESLVKRRSLNNDCIVRITQRINIINKNILKSKNSTSNILSNIQKLIKNKKKITTNANICDSDTIKGGWVDKDYIPENCEFDTSDIGECLFGKHKMKRVTIIGDSMAMRTALAFKRSLVSVHSWKPIKKIGRCPGKFYDKIFISKFDGKLSRDAGPVKYGISHPGCTDCSGCDTYTHGGTFKGNQIIFDYFAVEYAKDFELKNSRFNTTQGFVIDYLSIQKIKPGFIYLSFGAHDLEYTYKAKSADYFATNVGRVISLIKLKLKRVKICVVLFPKIWKNGKQKYQAEMNKKQLKILKKHKIKCIIDGYKISSGITTEKQRETNVRDGTHYPYSYYDHIVSLINNKICKK